MIEELERKNGIRFGVCPEGEDTPVYNAVQARLLARAAPPSHPSQEPQQAGGEPAVGQTVNEELAAVALPEQISFPAARKRRRSKCRDENRFNAALARGEAPPTTRSLPDPFGVGVRSLPDPLGVAGPPLSANMAGWTGGSTTPSAPERAITPSAGSRGSGASWSTGAAQQGGGRDNYAHDLLRDAYEKILGRRIATITQEHKQTAFEQALSLVEPGCRDAAKIKALKEQEKKKIKDLRAKIQTLTTADAGDHQGRGDEECRF